MSTAYVESSALAKVVFDEPESAALIASLQSHDHWVSSDLTIVEVTRAAARARGEEGQVRARDALVPIGTLAVDRAVVALAARLAPSTPRSLDAIHVATALSLAPDELVFYSYDARTIEAARTAGLDVASPS